MQFKITAIIFVFLVLITASAGASGNAEIQAVYDSLWNLAADNQAGLELTDFEFEFENGKFLLSEGQAVFFNSVSDHRVGLYFSGQGNFTFEGPTPVERFSIDKFTGDSTFTEKFEELILIFSPDIFEKYFAHLNPVAVGEQRKCRSALKHLYGDLKEFTIDMPARIYSTFRQSHDSPVFLAYFNEYLFIYDPIKTESLKIYKSTSYAGTKIIQTIVSCFPQSHYQSGLNRYDRDPVDPAYPMEYEISAMIETNTDITCQCRVEVQSNQDSLICLIFSHNYDLEMDSVLTADGNALVTSNYNKDEYTNTTVFLKAPLMKNALDTIVFYYHSKDIIKKSEWGDFYLFAPSGWYPRLGYSNYSNFKLKFVTPEHLNFIAVGELVSDSTAGDWQYTEWVGSEPLNTISFNYGYFDSLQISEEGLPDVKVYRSNAGHVKRLFGNDMLDLTARDILAAIDFCSNMFCPYPYSKIVATEIPMSHGQSFPGFLHLAWASFEGDYDGHAFEMDAFRAHEVSHQWWGGMIGYKSYHDQWLSEGFAEYTGAWYMQAKDGDNKRFLQMLKDWKDLITQKGGGTGLAWSEGSDAGPIWLGHRLASTKSSDYGNLVYSKGACVLHMLRMMLHDYNKNSDEAFERMLKDYVAQFRYKDISTFDFKRIVEKHFQMDMSWFFDQWIFSTEIPTYKPKYEVSEQNGKYILTVHTIVEDVPEDFQMIVPLVVEFGNDAHTVLKFWIKGRESTFTSSPLPLKPKKYIFNPYEAVLCHVKD